MGLDFLREKARERPRSSLFSPTGPHFGECRAMTTHRDAAATSIAALVAAGRLDLERDAVPVATLTALAVHMDDPETEPAVYVKLSTEVRLWWAQTVGAREGSGGGKSIFDLVSGPVR